jgi:D-alanyl-D-alanine dipeptidase
MATWDPIIDHRSSISVRNRPLSVIMFARISLKDRPLRKRSFALHKPAVQRPARILIIILSLTSLFSLHASSQVVNAASPSWTELVGAYNEPATGKSLRILIRGGQLICQSADGLAVAEFRLLQAVPGDVFETVETNSHQQLSFFRDKLGKVVGLKFGGHTYLRDSSNAHEAPSSADSNSGPLTSPAPFPGPRPARPPPELRGKIGDFGSQDEKQLFILLERSKRLYLRDSDGTEHLLSALSFTPEGAQTSYTYASNEPDSWVLAFKQRGSDPIWDLFTQIGPYHRLTYSVPTGSSSVNLVKPLRNIKEIRAAALAATPPEEKGSFRKNDLVELARLDPAIRLDIRYATPNDFLGTAVYTQARAFLQRPAAEALVRALRHLQPLGYGLLIHDGYRPWYVTKIFWDATPESGKIFVADPSQGSRHNRGCAVDLTLYDLRTNEPVEMIGLYDEMSPRSFPDYPGGTSLQRWHRELLRWAMESEGFTVYESEWWHFDYKDWREYAIGNIPFEKLDVGKN